MSNQLQIESYRISMRKLRTFYRKVTEFLNDDKITCLQRPAAFAINGVYWRTEWCGYLCRWIDCLCKICLHYLCFISIFHRHITKLYIASWLSEASKQVLPALGGARGGRLFPNYSQIFPPAHRISQDSQEADKPVHQIQLKRDSAVISHSKSPILF